MRDQFLKRFQERSGESKTGNTGICTAEINTVF